MNLLTLPQPFLYLIGTCLSLCMVEYFAISLLLSDGLMEVCCWNWGWFFHLDLPLPLKFVF